MEVPESIIIESNKKTATQQEFAQYIDAEVNTDGMPINRNSSWKSYIENGITLEEGDEITIESSQINITGDPNSTMEFTRGASSQSEDPLVDNRCGLNIGYYITNKQQNNFPLPLHRHQCTRNITTLEYGGPRMNSWFSLSSSLPLMAVEGARYNPDFVQSSGNNPPNDIPKDIASWYLGSGNPDTSAWFNTRDNGLAKFYLPWLMWIHDAPLQNAPYELYKPNELRLYKHKYQKYSSTDIAFNGSYYKPNYFDLLLVQNDNPYFDLTENIIDIEIPEGFATPSSVGEYITSSLLELKVDEKKKYDNTTISDSPEPSYFKLEGVFNTQSGEPWILDENEDTNTVLPQILTKEKINDNVNRTFTTARTVSGTLLEDYLNGNFDGDIQYPFATPSTQQQNDRLFFSDLLDGDVKKTSTSIKFQSLKSVATPTVDILTGNLFDFDNGAVVDAGNKQPAKDNVQYPIFGKQVVVFENLPQNTLIHHDGTEEPKPKFWINNSGERECILEDNSPPVTGSSTGVGDVPATVYNSTWRTCPPVIAKGMSLLTIKPFYLVPTNIVATKGSIALLKRIFNTGQFIQDNEDVNQYLIDNNLNSRLNKDDLLRRRANDNNNILNKLVCKFQFGTTDDENTVTEAYYSTNQINNVAPVMPLYYYNPKFNDASHPLYINTPHQGKNMIHGGSINKSYMVLGEYNYTNPLLPTAPNTMPLYAQNSDGGDVGKWETLDYRFTEVENGTQPINFPTVADLPRLIGRCWWNKDVLDQTRITPNIRLGDGAIFTDGVEEHELKNLDIDAQKKGKDAKYEIEVKTSWDERLDPQSPKFLCELRGIDNTTDSSHFQYVCSTTNKYFDVSKLQGNVIETVYSDMKTENTSSIERSGLGVVVVYLKPECIDPNSDLYLGREFVVSGTHGGRNILDIPYICMVNMSICSSGDEPQNTDLTNRNKKQIPAPVIGEMFGSSLSCQDNLWSKIVNTQKTPPNMRCSKIENKTAEDEDGEQVEAYDGSIEKIKDLSRFRTNDLIPPESSYTYPSFGDQPVTFSGTGAKQTPVVAGADNFSGFYRMSDYVPYVKIGADDVLITFDDNYSRFSISNLHTPFYNGNKVNPYWVKVEKYGLGLNQAALQNYTKSNEEFDDKIKSINRFCAAISTYKSVSNLTRVKCYNYANSLQVGWKYTERGYCIPFSLVQSSTDIAPLQNSLTGVGILQMIVPYRNVRNPHVGEYDKTIEKQNINNLFQLSELYNGVINVNNDDLKRVGWKSMTPYKPIEYEETLFGKMGYSLEQIIPFFGRQSNLFNRNNNNIYIGYEKDLILKQRNMVAPFTTNAYISGSSSIDLTTNFVNMPMKNLGAPRNGISVNATAETDSLIAVSLPQKLAYSYLVVYSDILQTKNQYYGNSYLSSLPAIGYITRNYSSSDFFFAFESDWSFFVDKKRVLNEFTIDIRLPNGNKPPISDNSSILFKITKKKIIGILKDKLKK